jgi:hypothetical protein
MERKWQKGESIRRNIRTRLVLISWYLIMTVVAVEARWTVHKALLQKDIGLSVRLTELRGERPDANLNFFASLL